MRVVALAEDGVEDVELLEPVKAWRNEGWHVRLAGREAGQKVTGKRGGSVTTDMRVDDVDPSDLDVLLVPGGHAPDKMRTYGPFVELVRNCMEQGKLLAVICHGPQLLIEAGVVKGRRMTAWPSVWTDLRNAGAEVVDEQVVRDGDLITSRKPEDIPAFISAVTEAARSRKSVHVER